MTRLRWLLALPALLIATSGPLMAFDIKDRVGLFSAETVKKAQADLDKVEREHSVPVTIETVDSLNGDLIADVTTRHAQQAGAKGIYILIAKAEGKIFGEASKSYRTAFTRERLKTIDDAFIEQFKKKDFDAGLLRGVSQIESTVTEARPAAKARRTAQVPVAGKPATGGSGMLWLTIGLGILAVLIVIRVLGALFSGGNRGGYAGQNRMMGQGGGMGGGPGYGGGGGGGGFMSSMFGGIGGALAGNWLYDQFSGRHHDNSMNQSNYDPAAGAAPADAGPEWGAGGAEGDWGGGPADAGGTGGDWGGGGADAGGGGDWGGSGGGGGDWGGGGGGGDWGGGGGGDGGGW